MGSTAVEQTQPGPKRKKGKGALKAALVLALVIIIAVILIMPSTQDFLRRSFISPFQESIPQNSDLTFQRTLTIGADGGQVNSFSINLTEPQNISQAGVNLQEIESFSTDPAYASSVPHGSAMGLEWTGGPLTGSAQYSVTLRYQVRETAQVWKIGQSDSGTVGQVPNSLDAKYLGDEWKIMATDPSIVALSKQINGNEQNVYTILKNTYDWVTANIVYPGSPESGEPKSSLETLQTRVGDCDDQSNLYLGLIRAAGVPGWLQLGALYDKGTDQIEGHAWVQTYIPYPNGGGAYVNIDLVNKDFLEWNPALFCDYTDDGNANDLRSYYYTFSFETDYGSPSPLTSESFSVLAYTESSNRVTGNQLSPSSSGPLLAVVRS